MSKRSGNRPEWNEDLAGKLESFVNTWRSFEGTERSAAQDFLRSLLDVFEVSFAPGTIFEQHPVRVTAKKAAQASLFGEEVVTKTTLESMDMYIPKVCVWEMKAPAEKDLEKHHAQVLNYWSRTRTRYMVLCNFKEFWIYDTNDEDGQLSPKLKFPLTELPSRGDALIFLRGEEPDLAKRSEHVTADVASVIGRLVRDIVESSKNPERERDNVTKFVLQCVFAMFAEDTELIPQRMFTNVMKRADEDGAMEPIWGLFDDFARDTGKKRHAYAPYVNGPLFDRKHANLALSAEQIHQVREAAERFDWQDVRPEIFGSIFEQALDPSERHELGAHFTREEDIAKVVGPTVIEPWRTRIDNLRFPKEVEQAIEDMKAFHVLDPACGCGNFLYVVYREMKRLECALARKWTEIYRHKVAKRKADIPPPPAQPYFTLHQLHGIEINSFAAFLARVVLWIGEHLAKRELGLDEETLPLKNLDKFVREADALFTDWPRPEGELAIVGNPPYLGVRKLRQELGDEYVEKLFAKYPKNRAADYVTYWFTRALDVLKDGERAGFVCTNSVAQNESREASIDQVLAKGGTLTDAWKSYPWPGEAAVHIGIVNWVMGGYDGIKTLEGREVLSISPSLMNTVDITQAGRIEANSGLCFMGVTPGNDGFVLSDEERAEILTADANSKKVIRPYLIGRDVNREVDQRPTRWIVDFGMMEKDEAEHFVGAMRHVRKNVYPIRKENRREAYARNWWRFVEPRPGLRAAIDGMRSVLTITAVGPHLIVTRQPADICFDHKLYVVASDSNYLLGVLQSQLHEHWVRARPSTLKGDLSYTNKTMFETFPFPSLPDGTYDPRRVPDTKQAQRLAAAAEEFDRLRSAACRERELGLTKIHNLLRDGNLPDLARAYDAMNDAANACYGFPEGTWRDERELLKRLVDLNRKLAAPGADAAMV